MTVATVVGNMEISLNGVYYPIARPVQVVGASQYPGKVVIGDTGRDSNPNVSVLALSNWQGGVGLQYATEAGGSDRSWWSTCQTRYRNHVLLPRLATLTAASGVTGTVTVGAIGELASEIYGAFNTSVRKYNNTTDSWGSSLATLPAAATDAITFRMGGVVYLAFATTGGYTYTSDGVAYTDDTRDTLYFTYWDDRLWGIDNTGLLWYSTAIGVETDDAQLPLPDGSVTALFTARDASGEFIIYVATKEGVYAHDIDNKRFVKTELTLPYHPNGGKGTLRWREAIRYPAGMGVYKYQAGNNAAVITLMGLDRDDGLPWDKRGTITQLVGTHNDLLAIIAGATTVPALNMFDGSAMGSHQAAVIEPATGYSTIMGWDDKGWETKWLGGLSGKSISFACVSYAYSTYRLWWAHNGRVYYMPLSADMINPTEVTDFAYAATGEHITPWFNLGQIEVDKLAIRVRADAHETSSTETISLDYGTNLTEGWTAMGTITSDGITTYTLPTSANPVGVDFRWIRFRATLARGSTTTLSPHLHNITLEWRKKLSVKWGYAVTIDLSKEHKGNTPEQMRVALKTAISAKTFVEFTYRDDSTGAHTSYVDVEQPQGVENTGHDFRGMESLVLVEK